MNAPARPLWRRLLCPPLFSPVGFLLLAVGLALVFVACHLAGLRGYTCVLCGQSPSGDPADGTAYSLGCLYILAWFGAVAATPIFALAALIYWGVARMRSRASSRGASLMAVL